MDEPVYTVDAVAERLQVHPATVRIWLRQGYLRGSKLPGRAGWRVPASEIRRLLGLDVRREDENGGE